MTKDRQQLPSRESILEWIAEHPTQATRRDIARAFGIKGAARIDLRRLLRELEEEGHLTRRRRSYRDPDRLPPVSVLEVTEPDSDGDLHARPLEWHGEGVEPDVVIVARESDPALGPGERILARLTPIEGEPHRYEARLIRKLGQNVRRILGVFRKMPEGGRIQPVDKGERREWIVPAGQTGGALDGELVEAEAAGPAARFGLPRARVVARLGDPSQPRAFSLIAIHEYGIPDEFPDEVIAEADALKPAGLKGRTDLREVPFITMDPADARDHDDAVAAFPDPDPANEGGHILWVAIADVAHYVRPGTALDREARRRGNSTYFPDRVVPMLPERLSADLCSLHEGVPRAVIAVEMKLDAAGNKLSHRFVRGMIRSRASLNYEEVQAAVDGAPNARTEPLLEQVIRPLYAAYGALRKARDARQPLDLDLPERKIVLDDAGKVVSVEIRQRLDAHRLIEEAMILANVAAAETLVARRSPLLFRVHEEPPPEKLDALRETAEAAGFRLARGQVLKTEHLNRLLAQAAGTADAELINLATLRSMTQAYYSPENLGHFGLALRAYAHFTSPIRRYSDLVVHRGLISAHRWGDDGLSAEDIEHLEETARHISETERRSMMAERDTTDRYLAAFLAERVGQEFTGVISGVAGFGVFVKLDGTGADGLIPMRHLGDEYFHFNREDGTLMGERSGRVIAIGMPVRVKLLEAAPVTGGLMLELVEIAGEAVAGGGRNPRPVRGRGGPKGRKGSVAGKGARKATRGPGRAGTAPSGRSRGGEPGSGGASAGRSGAKGAGTKGAGTKGSGRGRKDAGRKGTGRKR